MRFDIAIISAMENSDKVRYAIVTGGGSGLGREFCLHLARQNWYVVVVDINEAAAQNTLEEITNQGGKGQPEQLDVADLQAWQALSKRLNNSLPRLDLLINNAGICSSGEVGTASLEVFQRTVEVNLWGAIYGCQTLIPWLKESSAGQGYIINIASIFGVIAPPAMGAYNISKAGVISLSETLATELTAEGIGVTVVIPGFFPTNLLDDAQFETSTQHEIAEEYMQRAKVSAAEVVDCALDAMKRKKLYAVLGRKARWYWRMKRLMPHTLVRLVAWRSRRKLQMHGNRN